MNLEQALKRIEELEKRVRQLEAAPKEIHYHQHGPVFVPQYPTYYPPMLPIPCTVPQWAPPLVITCGLTAGG